MFCLASASKEGQKPRERSRELPTVPCPGRPWRFLSRPLFSSALSCCRRRPWSSALARDSGKCLERPLLRLSSPQSRRHAKRLARRGRQLHLKSSITSPLRSINSLSSPAVPETTHSRRLCNRPVRPHRSSSTGRPPGPVASPSRDLVGRANWPTAPFFPECHSF